MKNKKKSINHLIAICRKFQLPGRVLDVQEFGGGNVNDTYLVSLDSFSPDKCILQRINNNVFPQPPLIMENMRVLADHIDRELQVKKSPAGRQWRMIRIFPAVNSETYVEENGDFWRAISFIDRAVTYEIIQDENHAYEAGYALGRFHDLVSNLEPGLLHDTLPGFHITPLYLKQYDVVSATTKIKSTPEIKLCRDFIERRRSFAPVLERAKQQGKLRERIIHGDPKVSNIMIDQKSGLAVSLIDLDTVKPGLIHYDLGDCLRSCCNILGEEADEPDKVSFDADLATMILQGYVDVAKFISLNDYDCLYDGVRLLPFELGLRFFTDYLAGNRYFKVSDKEQNLRRTLVQFQLTRSIESQEKQLLKIVGGLRN